MKAAKRLVVVLALLIVSVTIWAVGETSERPGMFTGNENHVISIEEAQEMMRNYRDDAPADARLGGFFGKETLLRILTQENCVGIRYYFAKDTDGNMMLILVGTDANGHDLIDGELAERSIACPPRCSDNQEMDLLNEDRVLTNRVAQR